MPDVFISYRTGDGNDVAVTVDNYLSARFGSERIFRAGKSIPLGEEYQQALLDAVADCMALVPIIGPGWSRALQLHDAGDWVRREILAAYDHGLFVLPVLNGRMTPRLDPADLPLELQRLADHQSLVLDAHSDVTGTLKRLGDRLAELVPSLRQAEQEGQGDGDSDEDAGKDSPRPPVPGPSPASAQNAASDVSGVSVQARDIGTIGEIGRTTNVTGNHGPVHAGTGDVYQGTSQYFGDRLKARPSDKSGSDR
jgi:hypothetical protein